MPTERLSLETGDAVKYNKLFKWAREQGLEVHGGMKFPDLLAVIQAAFPDKDFVEIETEADASGPAPEEAVPMAADGEEVSAHYRHDPKVLIEIASEDENGGKRPVPVCVNGDFIWIKRNTPVAIPYRFFLALRDAVQTDYRQEEGPNRTTLLIGENRTAFRYTVHESPTKEEIAAWRERTKDIGRDKTEDESLRPEQQDAVVDALATKLLEKLTQKAA